VNVTREFQRMLKNAQMPIRRFHDLRHTAATLLMAGNVHPRIVSELLGHSEIRTTLDLYSHVSSAMQREATEQLEAIVTGG
jgi:integrase